MQHCPVSSEKEVKFSVSSCHFLRKIKWAFYSCSMMCTAVGGNGGRGAWKKKDLRSAIFQAFCGDKTEEKGSKQVQHCPEHQDHYCKWNSSSNPPVQPASSLKYMNFPSGLWKILQSSWNGEEKSKRVKKKRKDSPKTPPNTLMSQKHNWAVKYCHPGQGEHGHYMDGLQNI